MMSRFGLRRFEKGREECVGRGEADGGGEGVLFGVLWAAGLSDQYKEQSTKTPTARVLTRKCPVRD
jgi:hypothetical protein